VGFLSPSFDWSGTNRRVPLLSPIFDSSGTNRGCFLSPSFDSSGTNRRVPLLSPIFDSSGTNRGGFLSPTFDLSGTNRRVRLLSPTFRHLVGLLGRVGGEASLPQCLYLHRTAQHRKTRTNMHATILHIMLDSNTRSQNPISPRLRTPYAVRP
jgi:hypothetical protein